MSYICTALHFTSVCFALHCNFISHHYLFHSSECSTYHLFWGYKVEQLVEALGIFIDLILPDALQPWDRLGLKKKCVPGVSHGVKAAGAYDRQPCHLHLPIV